MTVACAEMARSGLERLGMSVASEHLDGAAQRAAAEQWSYSHFLGYLLNGELEHRHRRTVETNPRFARFPYLKRLADFDFSAQPSLDRRLIDELATGRFLHEGRNIVLLGPPGVGKTHLRLIRSLRSGLRRTHACALVRRSESGGRARTDRSGWFQAAQPGRSG